MHFLRIPVVAACALAGCLAFHPTTAAELGPATEPPPLANFDLAKTEAQRAIRKFRVAPGFEVELVANEPQLQNPVAFHIGNDGKIYVSETGRYRSSALDIRHHMSWYDDDLAARTVEDRVALIKKNAGTNWPKLQLETETIRLLEDRDGDGVAEFSTVFADGFTNVLDGIASGVMSRDGWVYFTDIPSVWRLRDNDGDGKADEREQLSYGYGVHFGLTGHDLHGLIKGPDGRIYFSVGDRGAHVKTKEGNVIDLPDEGAVFRMEPDGSNLEVFARGLRNPQELAFNQYGDLFTGDNDCDHGDRERWVHVVDGADYGWRIGYQFSEQNPGGVWMSERIWWTNFPGRVAAYLPPLAHLDNGPSGLAYYPGTGLGAEFNDTFLLCHFKGQDSVSGIKIIKQVARGASYEVIDQSELIWNTLPTDVEFGPDGHIYFSDWVEGWPKSMKGRIYRMVPEKPDPRSAEVKKLLAEGMKKRPVNELAKLLEHADMRVRLEAQWELAEQHAANVSARTKAALARARLMRPYGDLAAGPGDPTPALTTLNQIALKGTNQLARLHAIWALGQIDRQNLGGITTELLALLTDPDIEIQCQAAALLGQARLANAIPILNGLTTSANARVKFFAVSALGKMAPAVMPTNRRMLNYVQTVGERLRSLVGQWDGRPSVDPNTFIQVLRSADSRDTHLRHACAQALAGILPHVRFPGGLGPVHFSKDPSDLVRLAVLLMERQLVSATITNFLSDPDPLLVVEAARAINDAPIPDAMPALAALLGRARLLPSPDSGDQLENGARREPRPAGLKSSGVAEAMSATDYDDLVVRPLIRRVLNANFRVGQPEHAEALAAFAADGRARLLPSPDSTSVSKDGARREPRPTVIDDARAEALLMLGQWATPSPRDKVLGLYRPLEPRDPQPAADALARHFDTLLADSSSVVQVAAINAVAELGLSTAGPKLAGLVSNLAADGRVRAAALKALAKTKAPELDAAMETARLDFDPALKRAAMFLSSSSGSAAAAPQLAEVLKSGSIEEKQVALAALSQIPGTVADEIIYGVLRPWVEGQPLDPALELDVLEASRVREDERIKSYLLRYETNLPPNVKTAAYHWTLAGGNVENGRKIFIEHPAAACYRCHAVDGAGGEVGPPMDGLASRVTPEHILEAIVDPNAKIAEGFENLLIELMDGRFFAGIIKQETETEIILASPEDGLVTLKKAEIKSRERGASGMPEGINDILSKAELRDVMAYLQSLK
jgi:quinoprotein glucose dehydrogenase